MEVADSRLPLGPTSRQIACQDFQRLPFSDFELLWRPRGGLRFSGLPQVMIEVEVSMAHAFGLGHFPKHGVRKSPSEFNGQLILGDFFRAVVADRQCLVRDQAESLAARKFLQCDEIRLRPYVLPVLRFQFRKG
jgi:hypothetical protein